MNMHARRRSGLGLVAKVWTGEVEGWKGREGGGVEGRGRVEGWKRGESGGERVKGQGEMVEEGGNGGGWRGKG